MLAEPPPTGPTRHILLALQSARRQVWVGCGWQAAEQDALHHANYNTKRPRSLRAAVCCTARLKNSWTHAVQQASALSHRQPKDTGTGASGKHCTTPPALRSALCATDGRSRLHSSTPQRRRRWAGHPQEQGPRRQQREDKLTTRGAPSIHLTGCSIALQLRVAYICYQPATNPPQAGGRLAASQHAHQPAAGSTPLRC